MAHAQEDASRQSGERRVAHGAEQKWASGAGGHLERKRRHGWLRWGGRSVVPQKRRRPVPKVSTTGFASRDRPAAAGTGTSLILDQNRSRRRPRDLCR
jgi:hypothetical protein